MSGHSKWSTIKHKKGALDAKRGKIFSKIVKEITVCARHGGGNPDNNPRLRMVIDKARSQNMPSDNIERAIRKGTGEEPGVIYEEMIYEGYGPAGVALVVRALSDNKNRTAGEVRSVLDKKGGKMGGPNSVAFQFEKRGLITVSRESAVEDQLMDLVIDAGAEDMQSEKEYYEIVTGVPEFDKVKKKLDEAKIATMSAEISLVPSTTVKVAGPDAKRVLDLVEALEDLDDVQNVYANFDISDEDIESFKE